MSQATPTYAAQDCILENGNLFACCSTPKKGGCCSLSIISSVALAAIAFLIVGAIWFGLSFLVLHLLHAAPKVKLVDSLILAIVMGMPIGLLAFVISNGAGCCLNACLIPKDKPQGNPNVNVLGK